MRFAAGFEVRADPRMKSNWHAFCEQHYTPVFRPCINLYATPQTLKSIRFLVRSLGIGRYTRGTRAQSWSNGSKLSVSDVGHHLSRWHPFFDSFGIVSFVRSMTIKMASLDKAESKTDVLIIGAGPAGLMMQTWQVALGKTHP